MEVIEKFRLTLNLEQKRCITFAKTPFQRKKNPILKTRKKILGKEMYEILDKNKQRVCIANRKRNDDDAYRFRVDFHWIGSFSQVFRDE